jgi:mRNA-degrading endonuclease RelE of RelBE toxin-antitoxin system
MKDRLILTDSFLKALVDMDKNMRSTVTRVLSLLARNLRYPGLNVEKIWSDIYTARVSKGYRLVHQPVADQIRLLFVGNHDDVYRFIDRYRQGPIMVVRENPTDRYLGELRSDFFRQFLYKDIGTISVKLLSVFALHADAYSGIFSIDRRCRITDLLLKEKQGSYKIISRKPVGGKTFICPGLQETRSLEKYLAGLRRGKHKNDKN